MRLSLVFLIVITFSGNARATAQRGLYDRNTVETYSGRITAIDTLPPRSVGGAGVHIAVARNQTVMNVHLGPAAFLGQQRLVLAVGDSVEVIGSRVPFNNAQALLAASVKKGAVTVILRDSLGVPLWSRGRRAKR